MWPFDQNNQQMYQQYANHADQRTYGQIPTWNHIGSNGQLFIIILLLFLVAAWIIRAGKSGKK